MNQRTLEDIMRDEKVTPVSNVNGTPLVSFEKQRDVAVEAMKNRVDFPERTMNPDGTIAKTFYATAAVNMEQFYDNRYRVVEEGEVKKIELVTAQTTDGYRAIKDQSTGRVFQKLVPVYVFKRQGKDLVFDKLSNVSDNEFISEFTHKLSADVMKDILPLIPVDASVAEDKLPI